MGVGGQPTRPGQRGPGHQPVVQVLVRQAPQRAQQRQQQERLLRVAPRASPRPSGQRRRAAAARQPHRQPAHRQPVQATDQGERIQMQRRAALGLRPVVCWRRDGRRGLTRSRNHGLISLARVRAASRDQPTPSLGLCNALLILYRDHTTRSHSTGTRSLLFPTQSAYQQELVGARARAAC